jgi:hypothetical protein
LPFASTRRLTPLVVERTEARPFKLIAELIL